MVQAIISFARIDKVACAIHMSRITNQLRPLLSSYYDRVHDQKIDLPAWLSHVQGFYAWGARYMDDTGEWVKFDGVSGNQVLLFQAIDAFCGLSRYLNEETRERNVPWRQRELCRVLEKHSFRAKLGTSEEDVKTAKEFQEIMKRLRVGFLVPNQTSVLSLTQSRYFVPPTGHGQRYTCHSPLPNFCR